MAVVGAAPSFVRFGQALADAREHGEPFEQAWRIGLRTVKPCSAMRAILAETQEAWQRAYDREPPTRAERAAGDLFGALEDEPA